ncbi:MAG: MFS transporter [Peptoniphilus sp.]|nr:MFS transporter [Peptoniphilus sp.]MDY3118256.1 MFS transporter [Peptoniphilus sp.]
MQSNQSLYRTVLPLYFTYFIHGIGVSILSQYKSVLQRAWGAADISAVIQVIAALGLGRLVALPLSGWASDKWGRKVSGLVGVALYTVYFFGIAFCASAKGAYVLAVIGGMANSFLDTCVTPTILELFKEKGPKANMFTKFAMSLGQFVLPFVIGLAAARAVDYRAVFSLFGALIALDGLLIATAKFPREKATEAEIARSMGLRPGIVPVVLMGFTATATFTLWLNCNQELGSLYHMSDPSIIQSVYAAGTVAAILATAIVVLKKIDTEDVLVLYPALCFVALAYTYFVRTPLSPLIGGFFIGYGGAGGVLQLVVAEANALYDEHKGKITSVVMMASSVANYAILAVAGALTAKTGFMAPTYVVLLNMAVTALSVLFALAIRKRKRG